MLQNIPIECRKCKTMHDKLYPLEDGVCKKCLVENFTLEEVLKSTCRCLHSEIKLLYKKKKDTKYIVVITKASSFTISALGDFLNAFYRTDGAEFHRMIGTLSEDGFFVPHGVITKIMNSVPNWKGQFKFYSQEGGGQVRKYSIPDKKKSAEEKKVQAALKEIIKKKKEQK